jgi:hypothetical protein
MAIKVGRAVYVCDQCNNEKKSEEEYVLPLGWISTSKAKVKPDANKTFEWDENHFCSWLCVHRFAGAKPAPR